MLRILPLTALAAIALSACNMQPVDLQKGYYWQRASVTEAAYMEGPKSQQMLNRDISRCVVEIRELERLGAIRVATPGDTARNGQAPDPGTPAGSLAQWDTPERDGYLRAEHLDYHDFETCMIAKGWERVEHVPYDVAERARETYVETIMDQEYRTRVGERKHPTVKSEGDFKNLNE